MSTARGPRVEPPRTEADLLARARALAGRTIGEVASDVGAVPPADTTRHKGFVGGLLERALGATAGSRSEPDFPALGVELKTIPVDALGRPRESTFVCSIALPTIAETDFAASAVAKKLARVLFVLVESSDAPLASRRVGTSLLWSPSAEERHVLESDYDALAERLGAGDFDRVTAHLGEALQVRPKAANARARRVAVGWDGTPEWTAPRGFYLRARFTAGVLERLLQA